MSKVYQLSQDFTACEKVWLLAGELLRDEGVEDVTARHLAALLGQALACVAIHDTLAPLDRRSVEAVLECANATAAELHAGFVNKALKHG